MEKVLCVYESVEYYMWVRVEIVETWLLLLVGGHHGGGLDQHGVLGRVVGRGRSQQGSQNEELHLVLSLRGSESECDFEF